MAYRVNALFNDGCMMMTDVARDRTPMPHERIFVQRGGRLVEGIVLGVLKSPFVFARGPVRVIDEVIFREGGSVIPFPTSMTLRDPDDRA
jgi:hypothetical protein